MSTSRRLFALALVASSSFACGKKSGSPAKATEVKPTDPRLPVGAFTVPLPAGWADGSKDRAHPGQVGMQTTNRTPPVALILSPAPSPMPFDPTDPAACEANGRRVPGVIGTPSVITLPIGKACVVESQGDKRATMTAIMVGDQGVMAQCRYEQESDHGACDAIVRAIALAK